MSEASRCQRGAARLLSLAPEAVQAEAKVLQPLLERLLMMRLMSMICLVRLCMSETQIHH